MPSALIGHTGFVGGNLLRMTHFDDVYNSVNIQDLKGKHYDLVVCAGAPAVKWKANQEPEQDLANLKFLMSYLVEAAADHLILISTVDVYPTPIQVDEDSNVDDAELCPYGRHRRLLEKFVQDRFECTILRLPGLFGPGLKKNVVYDFLHSNQIDAICPESILQFYPIVRIWQDIQVVRRNGVSLVNIATEPTSVRTIARKAFGFDFTNPNVTNAVRYDMQTKHAHLFGKSGAYVCDAEEVLRMMKDYVTAVGWVAP